MPNDSRIYRYPLKDKILLGFAPFMFSALAYITWKYPFENKTGTTIIIIVFLAFAVLCLFGFLFSFYSITVTEQEIIVRRLLWENKLAWNDIYDVLPDTQDSILLSDRNGEIKLLISSRVTGYAQLIWLIKQKRPNIWIVRDPWTFQEVETFHQRPRAAIYYGLGSIGMIVTIFMIPSSGNTMIDTLGRLLGCIVGVSILISVACTARKLEFQGPSLILSFYGGWKKSIHLNEINVYYVKQVNTRGGLANVLYLVLKNGKRLNFANYKEGMPLLASAFERWMKNHKTNAR